METTLITIQFWSDLPHIHVEKVVPHELEPSQLKTMVIKNGRHNSIRCISKPVHGIK